MDLINELEIIIWDRQFILPIEYEFYSEETVTEQQRQALQVFTNHPEWLTNAKSFVEQFCRDKVTEDSTNTKKDNIFSYIKPEYIFIKRDKKDPRIAIMCKYKYDLEHGLAVVFSQDGNIIVGSQDIIL